MTKQIRRFEFGWITPPPEKRRQNALYSVMVAKLEEPPAIFEKELPVPWEYRMNYDQGETPKCVGYSGSFHMSTNANIHSKKLLYSGSWLYDQACKMGNTTDGAYIWAACDVLRKIGLAEIQNDILEPANLDDGIKSYVWALTWSDVRKAIWNDQPVWFGLNWYSTFMNPKLINGDYWIGSGKDWGDIVGGHAIFGFAWSDKRNAVCLTNTWGKDWPQKVWMGKDVIQEMLTKLNGECALTLDRFITPIPVPAPIKSEIQVELKIDKKKYIGKLTEA